MDYTFNEPETLAVFNEGLDFCLHLSIGAAVTRTTAIKAKRYIGAAS